MARPNFQEYFSSKLCMTIIIYAFYAAAVADNNNNNKKTSFWNVKWNRILGDVLI